MNIHEIKKKVLWILLLLSIFIIPTVIAERTVGTNFILNVEQFESTQMNRSGDIRTLSASDDVPQFMEVGTNIDLKNWFYWLLFTGVITPPEIPCLVTLINPMTRNYTYSINIPLEYTINASDTTWVEIDSEKFKRNMTTSLLVGDESFDVDYDGVYNVTVYGSIAGQDCSSSILFTVDRTSEFERDKIILAFVLIISLFAIAAFTFLFSRNFDAKFKVLIGVLGFLLVYSALTITLLVEREYIKFSTINTMLGSIFSMFIYAAYLITSIILVLFIFNTIKEILNKKRMVRFDE